MVNVNSNSKKTLLLGSGFSKNFGGYLPKDVFLKIFNHKKINTKLRSYLLSFREDNYNFEGFYQAVLDLKCDQFSHEEIAAVKSVLTEIYKMMDDLFERKMRTPSNDFSYLSVINFYS